MKRLFLLALSIPLFSNIFAQCPPGESNLTVMVFADQYSDDENSILATVGGVAYTFTRDDGDTSGNFPNLDPVDVPRWFTFTGPCVANGGAIEINILDDFGDGIEESIDPDDTPDSGDEFNLRFFLDENIALDLLLGDIGSTITGTMLDFQLPNNSCENDGGTIDVLASGDPLTDTTNNTGFEVIQAGMPDGPCASFIATSISMEFYAFANSSALGGPTTDCAFGPVSMEIYNDNMCDEPLGTITSQGGTYDNFVIGQSYTLCGQRNIIENNYPTTSCTMTGIHLIAREVEAAELPISIININGFAMTKSNKISWSTANEANNKYQIIERSNDLNEWIEIGQVEGQINSNLIRNYSIHDYKPLKEAVYRLRSVDLDGRSQFSKLISIKRNSELSERLVQFSPTITSQSYLNFTTEYQNITMEIVDASGRLIKKVNSDETIASRIPIENLVHGVYLIRSTLNGISETTRFIKL